MTRARASRECMAASRNNLANAYQDAGRLNEAEGLRFRNGPES
jgi:hypothetical protein